MEDSDIGHRPTTGSECQVVFNVPPPTTVLATWEGITVQRGCESVWIVCDPVFEPDCFDEAIRLLGLRGREDYEIVYDPGTGREMFIFDERDTEAPVREVRDHDDAGVLPGLPGGGP
jgi:hypothetical protein